MITRPGRQNSSYTIADIYIRPITTRFSEVKSRFQIKYMWNWNLNGRVVAETCSFNTHQLWRIIDILYVDVTAV